MAFEHAPAPAAFASARASEDEAPLRILLLDNYDSYTWNLFQQLARVGGRAPQVVRNDEITAAELDAMELDAIVISPGPGIRAGRGTSGSAGTRLRGPCRCSACVSGTNRSVSRSAAGSRGRARSCTARSR